MSTTIKPIKLWGQAGPNPPKVAMLLYELGLEPDYQPISFADVKKPAYLAINPNGRLPSIQDPNTGITLWESGAIIEYLLEEYDKENKLGFEKGTPEYYHAKQWLFYQVTGQGPYFGQYYWFKNLHHEKVESAQKRYLDEIKRVTAVVEGHLSKQDKTAGGPWLVGNRYSYADLAWFMWYRTVIKTSSQEEFDIDQYPVVKDWLERISKREAVKKVLDNMSQ